ncbi:MAG: DNA alkylation repair protein [Acholeplasmataceae bacterium]
MSSHIVEAILKALKTDKPLRTHDIRAIGLKFYKEIKGLSFEEILDLCESMLQKRIWPLSMIAYDWAYRQRRYYTKETFKRFEAWQFNYIKDWYDCDDFNTHAFGYLLVMYPQLSHQILSWATHESFAVRRAMAVVLILPIKKDVKGLIDPFVVSDILMHDPHYLVTKGYGWMLKIYMSKAEENVSMYLKKHKEEMPRLAYRYAIENLPKEKRAIFLS